MHAYMYTESMGNTHSTRHPNVQPCKLWGSGLNFPTHVYTYTYLIHPSITCIHVHLPYSPIHNMYTRTPTTPVHHKTERHMHACLFRGLVAVSWVVALSSMILLAHASLLAHSHTNVQTLHLNKC